MFSRKIPTPNVISMCGGVWARVRANCWQYPATLSTHKPTRPASVPFRNLRLPSLDKSSEGGRDIALPISYVGANNWSLCNMPLYLCKQPPFKWKYWKGIYRKQRRDPLYPPRHVPSLCSLIQWLSDKMFKLEGLSYISCVYAVRDKGFQPWQAKYFSTS